MSTTFSERILRICDRQSEERVSGVSLWLSLVVVFAFSGGLAWSLDNPASGLIGTTVGEHAEMEVVGIPDFDPLFSVPAIDAINSSLSRDHSKASEMLVGWSIAEQPVSSNLRSPAAASVYSKRSGSVVMVYIPDESFGSGVVVNKAGVVLTNWHVVGNRKEVLVLKKFDDLESLKDSDFLVADVVATDSSRDLALLSIRRTYMSPPPVPIARLSQVSVGTDVVAIGHPNGLSWTLTEGIVSQIRKGYKWQYKDGSQHLATVIQTQTSISPGSSGGPLFNAAGELVGVNSFGAAGESLNFAVACNEIDNFVSNPPVRATTSTRGGDIEPTLVDQVDRDRNGTIDAYGFDNDGDGGVDVWVLDADEDGEPDAVGWDTNGDGGLDIIGYDSDYDGQNDTYLIDTDADGEVDSIGIDTDGDGEIDSYRSPE